MSALKGPDIFTLHQCYAQTMTEQFDPDLFFPPSDDEPSLTVEAVVRDVLDESASPAVFDPDRFERFCGRLMIDTKEEGRKPLKFIGSQRYFVEQIAEGLSRGIHTFVILKGRQIGISTVSLALDIYWMLKHRGLQGAVVTDTDENREFFRTNIDSMAKSLKGRLKRLVKRHNRVQLITRHGSRLMYMVAGTKKNGELGRAKSANYMHATEVSSWGDEEGIGSLVNTLAQKNPKRLYILESTARGFNMFYQIWETAKESKTQMAVFIGWWRNEFYSWPPESVEYQQYWNGQLTTDEALWVKDIWERYQYNITPSQIAWWRWYVKEQMKGDEQLALQEMPPTEEYAFQLSGSKFFSSERVNQTYQYAAGKQDRNECIYFRYVFGLNFEDTQFIQCETEADIEMADVTIWETPVRAENNDGREGVYTLGADPAYGSSEWADEFCGQLMRCYADKVVQVAELAADHFTDQQFAWTLAHLSGWYGNTMLSLEMQGPGGAVFNELLNLKRRAGTIPAGDPRAGAFDVLGRIRDYLWKKQDTITGNFAYQWQTNAKEKIRMMSTLRSYFERDTIIINSPRCVQQFRNIHRTGDKIGGEGRAKDDLVIALAIGTIAWNDWIMLEMQAQQRTYQREHRPGVEHIQFSPLEKSVINYLKNEGINFRGLTG